MGDPEKDGFLDDIAAVEAEAYVDELDDVAIEEDELNALRAERDELKDRFMRALADAVSSATDEQKEVSAALIEGVNLTMRELVNVFRKHGIEPITPIVGDKFDPKQHEAMFEADNSNAEGSRLGPGPFALIFLRSFQIV